MLPFCAPRYCVGHDADRGRSLLQDQEKYEAEQAARRLRQQGRQGCEQHSVSIYFYLALELHAVASWGVGVLSLRRATRCCGMDWRDCASLGASKTVRLPGHCRFLYDGNRIQEDDTPASLDMEDNGTLIQDVPIASLVVLIDSSSTQTPLMSW